MACSTPGHLASYITKSGKPIQIFNDLRTEGKVHSMVRALDIHHLLLLLPFIIHNIFRSDVDGWNAVPGQPGV